MLAYHFVGKTLRDGRPIPKNGELLIHDGPVKMCESGLHASIHPYDALLYAPGSTLCLVDITDIREQDYDKVVGCKRRVIARFDATRLLQVYARWCALGVLHNWDAPAIVVHYLMTGESAARSVAESAARSVAESAARSASESAARSVAESAARSVAESAARSVAESAAWSASESAAWSASESAARSAARSAAWSAAWSAARSAAWSAARLDAESENKTEFKRLVDSHFKKKGYKVPV